MRGFLSDRPIAFHPQLARLLGGINAALLFQQIAFWSNTKPDSGSGHGAWIWKTQAELEVEPAMTRYEQEGARRLLRRKGVVEEKRRGVPARLHYRINWRCFFELTDTPVPSPDCGKPANKNGGEVQSRSRELPEQERGEIPDKPADEPQANPESTQRDHIEKEHQNDHDQSEVSGAEAAWLEVASSAIEAGKAPPWFRPWCVRAELSGSTLRVRLPIWATVGDKTFAEATRSELGKKLSRVWCEVSGDPEAVLELEAR
jgi:hypothetical protein